MYFAAIDGVKSLKISALVFAGLATTRTFITKRKTEIKLRFQTYIDHTNNTISNH